MMFLLTLVTLSNAFDGFAAGETVPSASTEMHKYFEENQHKMTLETALVSIGKELPFEVMELLKSHGKNGKSNLRAAVGLLQNEKKHARSDWTTEELDRAIEILNKMYDQEQADLDVTLIDCTKFEKTMTEQMNENSRIRTMMAAETGEAVAQKLGAQKVQKETSGAIEGLNEEYDAHKQACDSTLMAARAQLAIAEFDLKVALKIQEQAECDDTAIAEAAALEDAAAEKEEARVAALATAVFLQKDDKKALTVSECQISGHSATDDSTLQFGGVMEEYSNQFKSKASWWAMQRAAKMALNRDLGKHAYGQTNHHQAKMFHPRHHKHAHTGLVQWETGTDTTTEDLLSMAPEVDLSGDMEEEAVKPGKSADTAAAFKCNVNAIPNCPLLSDAISVMVGEIRTTYQVIKAYVDETQAHCDELSAEFESQIKTNEEQFDEAGVQLVESGSIISTNQFKTEAKTKEYEGLDAELTAKQTECAANILALQETMCGIKIVRLELLQMAEDARIPADCEVGDWIPDECSASCEGGVQTMNRKIVTESNGGSACPPLSMEQACNEFPCPVDCVMEIWTGWTACTNQCGGGSTSRSRNVITKPMYKGKECMETSETKGCNEDSCNADCVLADWTEWGGCSKSCRGPDIRGNSPVPGIQTQVRTEISPARGDGECFDAEGPDRFQQKPCNDEVCPDNVVCNSKLDIMVLVDSSGSIGSRGFKKEQKFTESLFDRININEDFAKVGVIKYSYKVEISQPMTFDVEAAKAKVAGLTWDARTTSTSTALSYAKDALTAGGREGVDSIVFIVTDGMPNDSAATSKLAIEVKKVATLKFVVLGKNLDMEMINEWASFPPEQNVFMVKKLRKIDRQITEMIAGLCPSLECREDFTGDGADYLGCQDTTVEGHTCQAWNDVTYHEHGWGKYGARHLQIQGLTSNFCRNPDGESQMWCYTTNPEVRWEYCNPRESTEI